MQTLVPISTPLYHDLIRMSDGAIRPEEWLEHGFLSFLESLYLTDPDWFKTKFGKRADEFVSEHLPEVANSRPEDGPPLIWKNVTVPAGSEVRMEYAGRVHLAKIRNGKIFDKDADYSPSEWASHIANGTSRNAWRDLWFKFPGRNNWVLAQSLRRNSN